MRRSQFYECTRRVQAYGIEGLKDLPPIPKSHPMTPPEEVVQRILAFSLDRPARGCVSFSNALKLDGISVSSPTIQNILIKNGMASK